MGQSCRKQAVQETRSKIYSQGLSSVTTPPTIPQNPIMTRIYQQVDTQMDLVLHELIPSQQHLEPGTNLQHVSLWEMPPTQTMTAFFAKKLYIPGSTDGCHVTLVHFPLS